MIHFFLVLGLVDWNTLDADIKFSMYWLRTWFSLLSLRFSSFTLSTLCDKSRQNIYMHIIQVSIDVFFCNFNLYWNIPSKVFCSSRTCAINLAFSSCSSGLMSGSKPNNKYKFFYNYSNYSLLLYNLTWKQKFYWSNYIIIFI